MPNDSTGSYEVSRTPATTEKIRRWGERAKENGTFAQFAAMLLEIESCLTQRPGDWGDPIRNLRHLNMVMYRRLFEYLVVEYAVKEDARLVFVRDYRLVADNPFEA